MAHKQGQGSSRNGRDSTPKHRGVKCYGGQTVKTGTTIIRQCGTRFKPGRNVKRASDDTLFATAPGIVSFASRNRVSVVTE